jgi:hypothetical protein
MVDKGTHYFIADTSPSAVSFTLLLLTFKTLQCKGDLLKEFVPNFGVWIYQGKELRRRALELLCQDTFVKKTKIAKGREHNDYRTVSPRIDWD